MSSDQIIGDCKERVAFHLMEKIISYDNDNTADKRKIKRDKEGLLKLYSECYTVINGGGVE